MKRLQRKFLLISAAVHGTLLLIVLVGPGFVHRQSPQPENLPVLRVIPSRVIDAAFYQEANASPEPAPSAPTPQPTRVPPVAAPPRVQPITKPVQVPVRRTVAETPPAQPKPAVAPKPKVEPSAKTQTPKPQPTPPPKPAISVSKSLVSRGEESRPQPREDRSRADRAQNQATAQAVENRVQNALSDIRHSLSDTVVSVPGVGGAAYANYRQVVQSVYDQAWLEPQDVSRSELAVLVEVVIRQDGKVLSDRVLRPSGSSALDRSVQAALDRVRVRGLPRFPEETRDLQRTFRIEFNLRSRRLSG